MTARDASIKLAQDIMAHSISARTVGSPNVADSLLKLATLATKLAETISKARMRAESIGDNALIQILDESIRPV